MANRPIIKVTKVAQLQGHVAPVYDFALDTENEKIYSAGADGYIVEWDINQPDKGKVILKGPEAFYCISYEDGKVYAGNRSGEIFELDVVKPALISHEKKHKGGVFFANSTISGGEDGMLLREGMDDVKLSSDSLRCFIKNKTAVVIGSSDSNVYILDADGEIAELAGHTNSVFAMAMIDANTLVTGGRDAHLKVWDLTIGKEVHSVPAHMYQIKSLAFNGVLLSSSMDKTVKVWDDKLQLLKVIDFERNGGHTNCVNTLEWIDHNMFVSCSDDRSLILWQIEINP